jgi:GNAT superfamily N-acetyltransferase
MGDTPKYRIETAAERSDIEALAGEIDVWPTYNHHGVVTRPYWSVLYEIFPDFQFVLSDSQTAEILGVGNSIPCYWDGTVDGLPSGIDQTILKAFQLKELGGHPNTLSALAIAIPTEHQGKGLSRVMVESMIGIARKHGFSNLIAPVRPNWKERYPSMPIDQYVTKKLDDGLPFDPWIRVHVRMGADVLKTAPQSLEITGTVAEWEDWTKQQFPKSGRYQFPRGLSILEIDAEKNMGRYWEPNVWLRHHVDPTANPPRPMEAVKT